MFSATFFSQGYWYSPHKPDGLTTSACIRNVQHYFADRLPHRAHREQDVRTIISPLLCLRLACPRFGIRCIALSGGGGAAAAAPHAACPRPPPPSRRRPRSGARARRRSPPSAHRAAPTAPESAICATGSQTRPKEGAAAASAPPRPPRLRFHQPLLPLQPRPRRGHLRAARHSTRNPLPRPRRGLRRLRPTLTSRRGTLRRSWKSRPPSRQVM